MTHILNSNDVQKSHNIYSIFILHICRSSRFNLKVKTACLLHFQFKNTNWQINSANIHSGDLEFYLEKTGNRWNVWLNSSSQVKCSIDRIGSLTRRWAQLLCIDMYAFRRLSKCPPFFSVSKIGSDNCQQLILSLSSY